MVFYNYNGHVLQEFDRNDTECGELSVAAFNPAGDAVVFGGFDCFLIYGCKSNGNQWEEVCKKKVKETMAFLASNTSTCT